MEGIVQLWRFLVRGSQTGVPVFRRGIPITPGCENQQGLHPREIKGYERPGHVALKGLTNKLTLSIRSREAAQKAPGTNIWGESNFTNFRVRTRPPGLGATSSGNRSAGRHHFFFVELFFQPVSLAHMSVKSVVSINLDNTICTILVNPWDPPHPTCLPSPSLFWCLLHRSSLAHLMLQFHLKVYKAQMRGICFRLVLQTFSKVH